MIDVHDRARFEQTRQEAVTMSSWRLFARVLMGNHYDLVFQTRQPTLVKGIDDTRWRTTIGLPSACQWDDATRFLEPCAMPGIMPHGNDLLEASGSASANMSFPFDCPLFYASTVFRVESRRE